MDAQLRKRLRICQVLPILLISVACLGCEIESPVDNLVNELKSPSCARRIWAVQNLGAFKDPSSVIALAEALKDDDPSIRRGAAWALTQIDDPRAMKILIEALRHEDPYVRKEVARFLSKKIGYPERESCE
ncbi:MAG: HEAT repeat domain-containing protein [Desulfomonile tiedjei]|nr:HEAT repeat domain-containing protein [Desulfomonile tiedjei]